MSCLSITINQRQVFLCLPRLRQQIAGDELPPIVLPRSYSHTEEPWLTDSLSFVSTPNTKWRPWLLNAASCLAGSCDEQTQHEAPSPPVGVEEWPNSASDVLWRNMAVRALILVSCNTTCQSELSFWCLVMQHVSQNTHSGDLWYNTSVRVLILTNCWWHWHAM